MTHEPAKVGTGAPYAERVFHAQDDVPIYYRDYGDPLAPMVPVLCLTGLTRNSKDFHRLASRLAPKRRVLSMDYRGRGRSGHDRDWRGYRAENYVSDIKHLLAVANIHRVVIVGTSLGGILAMALGAAAPTALAGVVLNDIGPEVAAEGRARIAGYVGNDARFPDFAAAAGALKQQFGRVFADFSEERWLGYAHDTFVVDTMAGNVRLDYDQRLGFAVRAQASESLPNLWAMFGALDHVPVLAIRGVLSDVLSQATFDRMAVENPNLVRADVPNRGHVPILDESECIAAVDALLARV